MLKLQYLIVYYILLILLNPKKDYNLFFVYQVKVIHEVIYGFENITSYNKNMKYNFIVTNIQIHFTFYRTTVTKVEKYLLKNLKQIIIYLIFFIQMTTTQI